MKTNKNISLGYYERFSKLRHIGTEWINVSKELRKEDGVSKKTNK